MKRWQKKEKSDAKDFGGNRTPRSGGFWSFKGDVKSPRFLLESKDTEKKYFRIDKKLWNKIYNEALKARKIPILSIRIQDIDIIALDKNDFLEIIQDDKR